MSEPNKWSDAGRHVRLLFVDDEEDERALASVQLGAEGFEVVEAENGREALRIFDESPFDVVVTDIFMPDEDGIELIQALRRRQPQLPIVAITGGGTHHDTSALRVAAALGAGALLLKPFRSAELVAAIRRVLETAGRPV
jgi:CheY-like chemotaxis protein